jgi:hypothetical protein
LSGCLAYQRPETRLLFRIILLAGTCTAAVALTKGLVFVFLQHQGSWLYALAALLADRFGLRLKLLVAGVFLLFLARIDFLETKTPYNRVMVHLSAEEDRS